MKSLSPSYLFLMSFAQSCKVALGMVFSRNEQKRKYAKVSRLENVILSSHVMIHYWVILNWLQYSFIYYDYWKYKVWDLCAFYWIQTYRISLFSHEVICQTPHFKFLMLDFSMAGLDVPKFVLKWFQRFLFIVVIVISILFKTTFRQTSIQCHLLVKFL